VGSIPRANGTDHSALGGEGAGQHETEGTIVTLWRAWYITPVVLLLLSSPALCSWQVQESGVTASLQDVCFADSLHGWAVGDSSTIIATSDGGRTWTRQAVPVDSVSFRKVLFLTPQVGFAGGSGRFQLPGRLGYHVIVLRTVDGGSHWEECDLGFGGEFYFADMDFLDTSRGWVATSNAGHPDWADRTGVLLRTEDGGDAWTVMQEKPGEPVGAVAFWNDQLGYSLWPLGFDNFGPTDVYRTTDGGEQWDLRATITCCTLSSLALVSPDTMVAYAPWIESFDAGLNWAIRWEHWDQAEPTRAERVSDIAPLDPSTWWVLVVFSSTYTCSIFRTTDGGTTYTEVLPERSPRLHAMAALGVDRLWAVGKSGAIVAYKEGPTQVDECEDQMPERFSLHQNFPNPFNSATTIRFSVQATEWLTLAVYDIAGREVTVLMSQRLKPGSYSCTWNGKDSKNRPVSSGIYVCELRSSIHTARREMVLMR